MSVISVKNVHKKFKVYFDKSSNLKEKILFQNRNYYEDRWVLRDINMEIEKGEVVGLIGKNGCGKSTMLKLLSRIMYPDEGTVTMTGRVASLIELGAGFHPDMTGRENIYTNASIFGLTSKEIEQRIHDIIEFSELDDYIDNPVRTYSSGMYMRLAFSVAIHVDADILLIDEILAVGDANFQAKCFHHLMELKEKGVTIVIVAHDLESISKLCHRTFWLKDGTIALEDAPSIVIPAYYTWIMSNVTKDETELSQKVELELCLSQIPEDTTTSEQWMPAVVEMMEYLQTEEKENKELVQQAFSKLPFWKRWFNIFISDILKTQFVAFEQSDSFLTRKIQLQQKQIIENLEEISALKARIEALEEKIVAYEQRNQVKAEDYIFLYRLLLQREPEENIQVKNIDWRTLFNSIIDSEEFMNLQKTQAETQLNQTVTKRDYTMLYRLLLQREPEENIQAENIDWRTLFNSIIDSEEFMNLQKTQAETQLNQTVTKRDYTMLYRLLLQREPEENIQAENIEWRTLFNSIIDSEEFMNLQRTQDKIRLSMENQQVTEADIDSFYQFILDRNVEKDLEKNLNQSKWDVFTSLLQSEEYRNKIRTPFVDDIRAIRENLLQIKWELRDLEEAKNSENTEVVCGICGFIGSSDKLTSFETDCIFHGGHLTRHLCPQCGVIFGDKKFTKMSQQEKDHDYHLHYQVFSESDCTEKELRAFYMLNPTKGKKYLNYGCGVWSNTIEILREEGYQVFGYEPYANTSNHDFIITDEAELSTMKFDGIFSNDVLEHIISPVDFFVFLKSLLSNQEALMSHCTSCYTYKYEYTRFHAYFFTGDSLHYLCEKSGFHIVDTCEDMEENDFYCHVYQQILVKEP